MFRKRNTSAAGALILALIPIAKLAALPAGDGTPARLLCRDKELLFEANEGQTSGSARFLVRTSSYTILLNGSSTTLLFKRAASDKDSASGPLTMSFDKANLNAVVSGIAPSPAKINYLTGSDARSWKRNVSTYTSVQYASLYPGIDMKFYGREGLLEYDFVVKPGADPDRIALSFDSSAQPSITPKGDLTIPVGSGELRFHAPSVFEASDSTYGGTGHQVAGKYILNADHTVSFVLGRYNHAKTLIIDPVVTYSSYLGGTDDEGVFGIQRDEEGNIYLSGETSSVNFPSAHPFQLNEGGDYDAFVSKFDPSGKHLIYSTYLGGSGYDHAVGLAVDAKGDAYVAGVTTSANFPTKHALQATLKGKQNAFIAHLTHSGSDLVFATYLGGSENDSTQDIVIDHNDDIYITGATNSPDFPVTPGAYQTVCDGANGPGGSFCRFDAFVAKLNSNGSRLLYSTFLGGSSSDGAYGIAVDRTGAAYITGQAGSADFPLLHPLQPKLAGFANAFVSKLNPTGTKLEFSTYLGGSDYDGGTAIALGPDDEVYLTGTTSSSNFPLVKAFQTANRGGYSDCFVAKLSPDGTNLLRSTYFGGSGWDYPIRLAVDLFGSVSVIGFTGSTDLPTVNAVQRHYGGGSTDGFALKLLPGSFKPLYSTYLGGAGDEYGYGIYSEKWGGLWLGGSTSSRNFPVRRGYQSSYAGGPFDAFLTRLSLTIPDYFRILEDLIDGCTTAQQASLLRQVTTARSHLSNDNGQEVAVDLEQLDSTLINLAEPNDSQSRAIQRALTLSHHLQEVLKRRP